MMTACDLSAITKPWEVQSKVGSIFWTFWTFYTDTLTAHRDLIALLVMLILGCSDGGSRVLGAGRPGKDSS